MVRISELIKRQAKRKKSTEDAINFHKRFLKGRICQGPLNPDQFRRLCEKTGEIVVGELTLDSHWYLRRGHQLLEEGSHGPANACYAISNIIAREICSVNAFYNWMRDGEYVMVQDRVPEELDISELFEAQAADLRYRATMSLPHNTKRYKELMEEARLVEQLAHERRGRRIKI